MRGVVAIVAVMALGWAPMAQATQRYASPGGSGTECTQAKPCLLQEAAAGAKGGDEVIVTPGTYPISAPIFPAPSPNIQIHGEAGSPMPRVVDSASGPAFYLGQTGDSLSYLEIEVDSNGGQAVDCLASRVERVRAKVVGAGGTGVLTLADCLVRNSVFRVEGMESKAVYGIGGTSAKSSASVRNVTAIASGSGSLGATAEYSGGLPGEFTLELQNSVLQGDEADLKPKGGAQGPGNIAVTHSNFDKSVPAGEAKVIDGGGNQSAAPLFVSFEGGDFREAAGSPTIDAGSAGELGPLDLAGGPRIQGKGPDIGAYEFTPLPAELRSVALQPAEFRAKGSGEAVISAKKGKKRPPVGSTVSYEITNPGAVAFSFERALKGRKAGGKCVKATHANRSHKACTLFKSLNGGFSVEGAASGANSFRFSGRIGGKALVPGNYRLLASAGGATKSASFKVVK